MAEGRLKLEVEVQDAFRCIDAGQSFLLSGGAGSGKTYSLVQTIRQAIAESPSSKIACMTFTNAAVREIGERIDHPSLSVSTIHDFLWDNIKHFQREIRSTLVKLVNDPQVDDLKIDAPSPVQPNFFDQFENGVQYKEHLQLAKGVISHDELLLLAERLFRDYPKLCDIVKGKYKLILIDEYQDTHPSVVRIFLDHFKSGNRKCVIGFFGDAMQSIYDNSIGNLDAYKGEGPGKVREIKKTQNRRNPKAIIELANRLRSDGIVQVPSLDTKAPNMMPQGVLREGSIKFIYSTNNDVDAARNHLTQHFGWDFTNSDETKELNLTHNLIAEKAGFKGLMEIYDKDRILELKGKVVKKIKEDKITIPEGATFGDVIDLVNLVIPSGGVIAEFIAANAGLYAKARAYRFSDFRKVYADKDNLVDDKKQNEDEEGKPSSKRDSLIRHLFRIQNSISLYNERQFNDFMSLADFKINTVKDKAHLKDSVDALASAGEKTIGEVIQMAGESKICIVDDSLTRFQRETEYLYDRVKGIKFSEFQKLFEYLEGRTPFSTQHKTKGAEFKNVFVVLENGGWNFYNFVNIFQGGGNPRVLQRTQKIFYVCCTRSKENLAVFFSKPPDSVIAKAKEWFGDDNMILLP